MNLIEKMADKFDNDKLALKVVEECLELSEVLTKFVTKAEGMKPPVEKIVEEMGDVSFRMEILIKKLGIQDAVVARYHEKYQQIDEWFTNKFEIQHG